jgi:hypothetical protein
MPIPGDDLEVTDCVVIDHAYVGGRKQFLSELGLEDTASHLTAEKRELLESFLKIEDSLDQLQTDIIKGTSRSSEGESNRQGEICQS